MEWIPSELDLFSSNAIELAFIESQEINYSSIVPVNIDQPAEFSISGGELCKDLNSMSLYAKVKLIKSTGEDYLVTDKEQPIFVNNILASLIKGIQIYLNNTLIYNQEQNFHLIDYFTTITTFDHATAEFHLPAQGYYKASEAERKITEKCKNSRVFDLQLKLNCFNTNRLLLPNVNVTVKILFNPSSIYLKETQIPSASGDSAAPPVYTSSVCKLLDLRLSVLHKRLRESHKLALENQLAKQPAVYQFKKTSIATTVIPRDVLVLHINTIYQGHKPSLILACLMKNSDYSGDKKSLTYDFRHHDIDSFVFLLNDSQHPTIPWKFNFSDNEEIYTKAFMHTMQSLSLLYDDSCLINFENYKDNFIISSDLTPSLNANSSLNQIIDQVTIGAELTFKSPVSTTLNFVLLMVTNSEVQIDLLRNVSLVY